MILEKPNIKRRNLSNFCNDNSLNYHSMNQPTFNRTKIPFNIPKLKIPRQIQFSNIISSKCSSSSRFSNSSSKRNVSYSEQHAIISKINSCDKKLSSLLSTLKQKCSTINELTLQQQKIRNSNKLEEIKDHYLFLDNKLLSEIEYLKEKLYKKEQTMLLLDQHSQNINNENLNFKNKKLILLDKLIEYRSFITKLTKSNRSKINDFINLNNNSNYSQSKSSNRIDTSQNQMENYLSSQCSPKQVNQILIFTSKFLVKE